VRRLSWWLEDVRRYGVWPRTRRRRIAAEWDRNRELNQAIVSVVTLLRGPGGKDEAGLIGDRIMEVNLNALEANAVLGGIVRYSALSQDELRETVMWHKGREARGRE